MAHCVMSYQPDIIGTIDGRVAVLQKAIDAVGSAATSRLTNAFSTISQELASKASVQDVQEIHEILETKADKPKDEPPAEESLK